MGLVVGKAQKSNIVNDKEQDGEQMALDLNAVIRQNSYYFSK